MKNHISFILIIIMIFSFCSTANADEFTDNQELLEDSEYKTGDLDYDGQITSIDALFILRMSVELERITENNKRLADVDSDNNITANDALSVLRYSVGISDNTNDETNVIGAWTFKNDLTFVNMFFKDDSTVLIQSSDILETATWCISGNKVTVTLYESNNVYTYKNDTLVNDIDNSIIYTRGTTKNEKDTDSEISVNKQIPVENILQNPELPTGCESVSLTMVLNHLGYPADKFEIVRKYLPKQEFYYVDGELYGADFTTTFAGDPEDENSYGCYAPCIVITANNYLSDKGFDGIAYDLTSTDFEVLLSEYIDKDIPLIIWITNNGLEPSSLSTVWKTPDGQTVQWRRPEHCVVLTGYDRSKNVVFTSDPIYGNTEYDFDTLSKRYDEMGKQAVFIDNSADSKE